VRRMILNGQDLPSRDLHRDGWLELPRFGDEIILIVKQSFLMPERAGACIGSPIRATARPAYSKGIEARAPRVFCCSTSQTGAPR